MTVTSPFDHVLKVLARDYAESFLRLSLPGVDLQLVGTVENVELTIPEGRVDFVHRVLWGEQEYIFHLEFQTYHQLDVPERLFVYSALLTRQLGLPVLTVVIYLTRREAPIPTAYEVKVGDVLVNHFGYQVVKLWKYADEIASGRWPELAPLLVTLTSEPDEEVLARERELILQEADPSRRADLLACAVTLGARYFDKDFLWRLFREEVEMFRETEFLQELFADKIEERARQALQEGLEQGLEQGREQGLAHGRKEGLRTSIEQILSHRFDGRLTLWQLRELLEPLPVSKLETLIGSALDAPDLETFIAEVDDMRRSIQQSVPA